MLRSKDYTKISEGFLAFQFQSLQVINSSDQNIYRDSRGNRYYVINFTYKQFEQIKIIDRLGKRNIIINYKGSLKKTDKNVMSEQKMINQNFTSFFSLNQFVSLATYVEKFSTHAQIANEKFCVELIQSILLYFIELEQIGQYLKILDPYMIGVKNIPMKNTVGFGLLYPFIQKNIATLEYEQYKKNINYCAPEIIRHFTSIASRQKLQLSATNVSKDFRKACLYSLGLIIAFCFGHVFTVKQRIQASKNDRDFRLIFKKIRKEIKQIHKGKYIPKILKLLLEDCEKSRQTLETFDIKIHSFQMQSLKICKNCLSMNQIKISTIPTHTDIGDKVIKKRQQSNIDTIYGSPKLVTLNKSLNTQISKKSDKQIIQTEGQQYIKYLKKQEQEGQAEQQIDINITNQSIINIDLQITQEDDESMWGNSLARGSAFRSSKSSDSNEASKTSRKKSNKKIGKSQQCQQIIQQEINEVQSPYSPTFANNKSFGQKQYIEEQFINYYAPHQFQLHPNSTKTSLNRNSSKIDQKKDLQNFQFTVQQINQQNFDNFEGLQPLQNRFKQQELLLEEEQDIGLEMQSLIRQEFHNETKCIMGIVLIILLFYALVGQLLFVRS